MEIHFRFFQFQLIRLDLGEFKHVIGNEKQLPAVAIDFLGPGNILLRKLFIGVFHQDVGKADY